MKADFRVKILLIFSTVLISLVLSELILRIATPLPENLAKLRFSSHFLYENKPNAVFPYVSSEFNNEISINSYGFRDDEFSLGKPAGVLRIAVLGDSQEEALQVELSDTWQKVMARKLSEELKRKASGPGGSLWESETALSQRLARRVESYNFGFSGYGTDQEWLTLREKVWQFSPDLIILAFSPNDVGDTYKNKLVRLREGGLEIISAKERSGGNFWGKLVRETYTYHLVIKAASGNEISKRLADKIRTKILGFPKDERFFLSDAQLVQGPFEVIASQKTPPREVLETWQLIREIIADMKAQADDHQAQFLITINIPRAQVEPSDWEFLRQKYNLDPNSSSPYQINEVMGEIAKELGVDFYDLRLAAIEWMQKNGDLHLTRDAHFNKNGHLFMGTKVAEYILSRGLLDN